MKSIRRIVTGLLVIDMVWFLAACGGSDGKEQTVVLRIEDDVNGMPMSDTMTLTAVGDVLQHTQEVMELDVSSLDDETKEAMFTQLHVAIVTPYDDVDLITADDNITDTTYTVTIEVDLTSDYEELAESGVIGTGLVSAKDGYVSLMITRQNLEAKGYQVIE